MKKLITIYFYLSSLLLFSQNKVSEIYFGCFTDGDTLSKEVITKNSNLSFVNGGEREAIIKSWEMSIVPKDRRNKKNEPFLLSDPKSAMITPQMKEAMLSNYASARGIIIRNIVISYTDRYTGQSVDEEFLPVTFYFDENSFKNCDQKLTITATSIYYNGKLLTGKDKNLPVADQKITLETTSDKELQSTVTNKYGSFTFTNLTANNSYKINVPIDAQSKIKDGQLYMAKPDGTIINNFNKTSSGFVYELLPEEINKIKKEKEEDTELEIKKFDQPTSNIECNGKLLTGKNKNVTVPDQKVILETSSNKEVQSTVTNELGNFTFKNISATDSYKITVPVDANSKIQDGQLYMAKQDGTVIKSFNKTENGFVYELLPNDPTILTKIKEEDPELKIKNANAANSSEYLGKLMTGKDKKAPLSSQKIILRTASGIDIQSTITSSYGNFTLRDLNSNNSYKIAVIVDGQSKIPDGELYMAKLDGTIIKAFNKTPNGFEYELLPEEIK